nr:MAG TPA: hypothetical protein [Caudoviricetes sp.]
MVKDRFFRIYMQKESNGAEVKDTITSFGMYVSENPFKPCEAVKEPTKRTWNDNHGDDEYISPKGLFMAAYEKEVKFLFKSSAFGANEKCKAFIDYLRTSGMIKMYCEFNKVGRRHVRLKSISPTLYRDPNNEDILTLPVTFKFNDPVTDIVPHTDDNGNIDNLIDA